MLPARIASIHISLTRELQTVQQHYWELKSQCMEVMNENKRLLSELKKHEESKMHGTVILKSANVLLGKKIEEILKCQESLHTKINSLINASKDEQKPNCNLDALDVLISECQNHYIAGINILSSELHESRNEIKTLKQEIQKQRNDLSSHATKESEYKMQLESANVKIRNFELNEVSLKELIVKHESDSVRLKNQADIKSKELNNLIIVKEELLKENKNLKKEKEDMRSDFHAIQDNARKCVLTTEKALLLKKSAEYREQQAEIRIDTIMKSIDKKIEIMHLKHKDEVKKIMEQHVKEKQILEEKIRTLEADICEKQCLLDKVRRINDKVNSKLEMYAKQKDEYCVSSLDYNSLCEKLILVEKERDEVLFQLKMIQRTFKDTEHIKSMKIERLTTEKESLQNAIETLKKQFDVLLHDKSFNNDVMEVLRLKCSSTEEENKTLQMEVQSLKEFVTAKEESCNSLLQTIAKYEQRILSLEKMLKEKQELCQEWKDLNLMILSLKE